MLRFLVESEPAKQGWLRQGGLVACACKLYGNGLFGCVGGLRQIETDPVVSPQGYFQGSVSAQPWPKIERREGEDVSSLPDRLRKRVRLLAQLEGHLIKCHQGLHQRLFQGRDRLDARIFRVTVFQRFKMAFQEGPFNLVDAPQDPPPLENASDRLEVRPLQNLWDGRPFNGEVSGEFAFVET